ncbi:UDP-2,3-diacylglucosamine diphosphatase LpxI domain-containing protein [Desulfoferrobacter suflitae]|uniref:UDP-2,3-diacylglucosamine diphosphatase LpxI domain-containing protein n=1 Tax=Desulfoferrobacter suflitae TaxID=2865782 RepID=UPI002164A0C9|nr:UDP-2,3-diacylglucosamine diphosphatase LpxI [Desulfoferrobacter suflitae]MCK8600569.1 UDP-2,3-diacylglucosamine diphosphatase LpxI [Desulfoferrobacter suflitae]
MSDQVTQASDAPSRIGLIAGSGQFPLLFAHASRQANVEVVAVGFEGETDPALGKYVARLHMLKLGQLNKLIRTLQGAGITRAAMVGAINKAKLYTRIRPDWRAVKFMNKLRNKKDDFLLRALAEELETEGIRIEPSTIFLPELIAPAGILTRRKPNRREAADIEFGWEIAKKIGDLDIGQCLVVKNQAVLAVEGIDGTDATVMRGGRLCREGAVVIKVSKPNQDLRFDVPAVGFDTIETMKRVRARLLVIEAGKTLIFDRGKMIDAANEAGITILAQADDNKIQTSSPVRKSRVSPIVKAAEPGVDESPVLVRRHRDDSMRIGVIGVGYLGRFHAQKYARLPEANIVAVVDINPAQAAAVAQSVKTQALTDYRELFGRVDAVSIVTPTQSHYTIARDFLERGVHVLLEKPMTQTLEEADHLNELAGKNGCVLQVGHLERFNSAFNAIQPRLKHPAFMEAHRLALFNERGLEVDVILDLMIHDIDIILHIVQAPLTQVRVAGVAVLTSLPDIANVRLEFADGSIANLTASRISLKSLRKLRIFQENCYIVADFGKKQAYAMYRENEPDESGFPQISIEELEVYGTDALEEEIISFLDAVRSGVEPVVSGHEGRRALAVALEISNKINEQMRKNGILPHEYYQNFSECR